MHRKGKAQRGKKPLPDIKYSNRITEHLLQETVICKQLVALLTFSLLTISSLDILSEISLTPGGYVIFPSLALVFE